MSFLWKSQEKIISAKVFVGSPGTTIPTSAAGPGDFTTKLLFQTLIYDDLSTVVSMVDNRLIIPTGYRRCRINYCLAWDLNATGWRGCRIKNSVGSNYGNVRMPSVGAAASTNNSLVTSWINISSSVNVSPDTIQVGDYFEFWPAQNSGVSLICGADSASSWVSLELQL